MITLQYALTKEDYENYYCMIYWDSPINKTKRSKEYAKTILLNTLLLIAILFWGIIKISNKYSWFLIAGFGYTVYLQVKSARDKVKIKANQFISRKENAAFLQEVKYTFSENDIVSETPNEIKHISWNDIIRLEENDGYYIFLTTETTGIVLPKVHLNETNTKALSHLISEKISLDATVGHLIEE